MSFENLFDKIQRIQYENVNKYYDDVTALKDFDLEVVGGELLVLIGPSGSGKTTALRMLNRMVIPDTGKISIDDMDITKMDPIALRRSIGYVIQDIGLLPHMRINQNIGMIPRVVGWEEDRITNKVDELLNLVSLSPDIYRKRFPRELSGGQQQRVGLARAFAMDPSLLLMDEPFGALDPILRSQLQDEFLEIKTQLNKTILFVTHDIEEAFKIGDRVGIMKSGELVQLGTRDEIVTEPANDFVRSLVGTDKKFRYLDYLKVKEMMEHIDSNRIFDLHSSPDEVVTKMEQHDLELGIVTDDEEYMGIITQKRLRRKKPVETIEDLIEITKVFNPEDSLASALKEMKDIDRSQAIVVDKGTPIGILLAQNMLMKLI